MNKFASRTASARPRASATSKDGYVFNPDDDRWVLNKDVVIPLSLPAQVDQKTSAGFRLTLQRYAEEMSAGHTQNMAQRFRTFLRDTGATSVTKVHLINWRAMLGEGRQWILGSLRGFIIAWHEYGFGGVSQDVVDLLQAWRIEGNAKGVAVASGCPEAGAYTDLEMASMLEWANSAVARNDINLEDYAYLLTLAMTARRSIQIAALKRKDLLKGGGLGPVEFRLNVPRVKQRGIGFRCEFRSLAIIEDLYLVLEQQSLRSVAIVEAAIQGSLGDALASEVPVFLNLRALRGVNTLAQVRDLMLGSAPDRLHASTSQLEVSLRRCARLSTARSERTGEFIHYSATRFRRTRGTKLRREGFGPLVIADLLDHSDIQNVRVYTENTAQEAVVIDELIGAQLAPFAQACLGTLVGSERDAVRGGDPSSRVSNDQAHGVGTCGSYGFCASGYRACYTCYHFQPWVDGPHEEVLHELYGEKHIARESGCAELVVSANDQLILAVEHCILLCKQAKREAASVEGVQCGKDH